MKGEPVIVNSQLSTTDKLLYKYYRNYHIKTQHHSLCVIVSCAARLIYVIFSAIFTQ